jgi:ATP/maltotriose-dependent transcriptional regulator MalT
LVIDAMAGTLARGPEVLARLAEWVTEPPTDPGPAALLATAAFNLADFDRALIFADRAVDVLRAQGRLSTVAQVQVTRAWAALYVGRWDDAYVAADEAYRLAVETRQPVWAAHARLGQADLEGRRGRPERALELIVDAERLAVLTGRPTALGGVEYVRGIIELGRQRPHAAYEHLRRTMDPADRGFHSVERLWLVDSFVEAAAASGHTDHAHAVLAEVEPLIAAVPSPGYHRAVGLAKVLLADDLSIDNEVARARQAPGRTSNWFEARVDLAHGMSLRRRRRAVESRRPLSSALTIFTELGAAAWAQRAAAELSAGGAVATQPDRLPWSVLSPQELHIAQLAAQGLSNREIGDRLFLSHRTVGSHLYRIFPKLNITSRNQLHLVLPGASPLDRIG